MICEHELRRLNSTQIHEVGIAGIGAHHFNSLHFATIFFIKETSFVSPHYVGVP
jgi:hypothetical protein